MNLGPIPAHLARFAWYAPHQAWLRDEGLPHHDPGDAQPKRAILTGANLTGADLTDANLTDANLTRAYLTGADLTDADLTDANLTGADLTGADLTGADLTDANLTGADLTGADLTGADLTRAYLTGADLTGADLTGADLTDANLTGADLTGADLTGADLTDANLTGADLTGADGLPVTHKQAVANLDAIREIVLASPERCFMSLWHGDLSWESRTSEEEISCGTTHCLAGWAQVLTRCGGKPWCEGILQIWPAAHMTTASNEEALEYLRNREYAKGA